MYEKYLSLFYKELPLGETFDLIERKLVIGGRMATCFFVDGLTNGDLMQRVMDYLMKVQPEDMEGIHTSHRFLATHMPFLDATLAEPQLPTRPGEEGQAAPPRNPREWSEEQIYSAYHVAMTRLYSGLVPLMVEGLDRIIIIDARDYPSRPVEEPQKEKSLRGAKDGFTEGFMTNIALIRRRLRDNNLIFTHYTIGSLSKSDVAMVYMKDKADSQLVNHIGGLLKQWETRACWKRFYSVPERNVAAGEQLEDGSIRFPRSGIRSGRILFLRTFQKGRLQLLWTILRPSCWCLWESLISCRMWMTIIFHS